MATKLTPHQTRKLADRQIAVIPRKDGWEVQMHDNAVAYVWKEGPRDFAACSVRTSPDGTRTFHDAVLGFFTLYEAVEGILDTM